MTAADLLDSAPVHSINNVARILCLFRRNGEPNRRAVHDLIRSGALALVDNTQGIQRWTISRTELYRYIAEGPRQRQEAS